MKDNDTWFVLIFDLKKEYKLEIITLVINEFGIVFLITPKNLFYFIGYVQSLIRRVVNNVNIVINNLILKYVEDDIVLSVNITSAECYTVDEFWDRAFMDISGE